MPDRNEVRRLPVEEWERLKRETRRRLASSAVADERHRTEDSSPSDPAREA